VDLRADRKLPITNIMSNRMVVGQFESLGR